MTGLLFALVCWLIVGTAVALLVCDLIHHSDEEDG